MSRPAKPAPNPRDIALIVIHCSATMNGDSLFRRGRSPVEVINAWHRDRGFKRGKLASAKFNPTLGHIGYHYVLYTNGALATGRAESEIGAHAKGYNKRSIGLCLIGTDRYTRAQWNNLADWITLQRQRFPGIRIVGHRDLSPDADGDGTIEPREWFKTCPGFDVATWLAADMTPSPLNVLGA